MHSNIVYKDGVLNVSKEDQLFNKRLALCGEVKNIHVKLISSRI